MDDLDFTFERIREADLPLVHEWLHRPHVAHWWGDADDRDVLRTEFILTPEVHAHIVKLAGEPIGFIQSYIVLGAGGGWWEDETDPGARGVDQFLADEHRLGKGLGRRMIRAFLRTLFADPAVTVVQTDPNPDNERARRAYVGAGFVPVGVVPTPDGPALLMRCTRESLARAEQM